MGVRIPKNQIQEKKYTNGKEYMFETTYREYKGYYYEVNGRLFAGEEVTTNSPVLIPIKSDKVNNLLTNASTYVYGVISNIKLKNTKVTGIPKSDIDNTVDKAGETFLNFYCQSSIDPSKIKEIDENTFKTLQEDPLYKTSFVGTYNNRTQTLDQAEKQISNITLFVEPTLAIQETTPVANTQALPPQKLFPTSSTITGSITDTPKPQDIVPVGPIYEKGAIFVPPLT
jgi:hypothetical protein